MAAVAALWPARLVPGAASGPGMGRPAHSLREGRPMTTREAWAARSFSRARQVHGGAGGRRGTEGTSRVAAQEVRWRYSQDVHDDAQGPHVTRLVILLWT